MNRISTLLNDGAADKSLQGGRDWAPFDHQRSAGLRQRHMLYGKHGNRGQAAVLVGQGKLAMLWHADAKMANEKYEQAMAIYQDKKIAASNVMRPLLSKYTVSAIILLSWLAGCHTVPAPSNANSNLTVPQTPKTPFTLSIVPTTSSSDSRVITIALQKPDEFYVVLTNISNEAQPVWEYWNSWGYQTISFEFMLGNNRPILVGKRPQGFTINFASTFLIPPGEHKVYAIRLDKDWDIGSIPKSTEMLVSLKAVYEVSNTPEAANYHVWTGRVESSTYNVTLKRY